MKLHISVSTTGECVRFAAQGNDLVPVSVPTATLSVIAQPSSNDAEGFTCIAVLTVSGYEPGTYTVQFSVYTTSSAFDKALVVGPDGSGSVSSLDGSSKFTYGPSSPDVTAFIDGQPVATESTSELCSLA